MNIPQAQLRQLVRYDPETGKVFSEKSGAEIGHRYAQGYRGVSVLGQAIGIHRLAFLYMTGELPRSDVDHINGDKTDNRWCNLRVATRSLNSANRGAQRNNTTGLKGVTWFKRRSKFVAGVKVNGRRMNLGYFDTAEEAHAAYCEAARNYFGEYAKAE